MAATSLMRDGDAWQVDPLPDVHAVVTSAVITDWNGSGEPHLYDFFDVSHDATARFYATSTGVSPCVFDDESLHELKYLIPMGYTTLTLYEKRAVVSDGALVRLWPEQYEPRVWPGPRFDLVVPLEGEHRMLRLMAGHALPGPLLLAENLSSRLGQPILVARLLEEEGWH